MHTSLLAFRGPFELELIWRWLFSVVSIVVLFRAIRVSLFNVL